ncbi:MAG TPA: DUF3892 domain-containing protein [Chloroflexia bacterium]|nr:DUF3892 domain-containing protein [Chloroflexia bacterium]
MPNARITCINKQNRQSEHEGITHLGGGTGADRWRWTRQEVIASIEAGTNTFYTLDRNGKRADVGVIDGPNGKYVRTHADGEWNDNLLSLDECPI